MIKNFIKKYKPFHLSSLTYIIQLICLILLIAIGIKFIEWGLNFSFDHYPISDEIGTLALASNIARFGKYSIPFDFYSVPNKFNPFVSCGPAFVIPLSIILKIFGYHFIVPSLFFFLFITLAILICYFIIIWLYSEKNRLIISTILIIIILTNRLFYFSDTGGSLTHGAIAEPTALLYVLISLIFVFLGFKKNKYLFFILAGFFAALAYLTKIIVLLYIISQSLSFLLIFIIQLIKKNNWKNLLIKISLYFITFSIFISFVSVWKASIFTNNEFKIYKCWEKAIFLEKGSGIKNLMNISLNILSKNYLEAKNSILTFYSTNPYPIWTTENSWGPQDRNGVSQTLKILVIMFAISILFLIKKFIDYFRKNDGYTTGSFVLILTTAFSFIAGNIWFFFISDFHWIRHYYIFQFLGILYFVLIFSEIKKELFFLSLAFIVLFFVIPNLKYTPFLNSTGPIKINNKLESKEWDFINNYNLVKFKHSYVCGAWWDMTRSTFLSGIQFNDNVYIDNRSIYPLCNFLPSKKIRVIQDKQFNIIVTDPLSLFLPDCSKIAQQYNMKLIYKDLYAIYTTN